MSQTLLEELDRQGITVTVEGDKLALSALRGVITPEVVDKVAEQKAELMLFLSGYRLKYPGAKASDAELAEIVKRVRHEGYVLLWSNVLRDLVAFYRDEEDKGKIPHGFVPYSEAELRELFGGGKVAPSTLRFIHEAKKLGARVVGDGAAQ